MKLIVGLGNPGRSYVRMRHNVGFLCVEAVARRHRLAFSERRRLAVLALGRIEDEEIVLVKPRTFVNQTGRAITYLMSRFHTTPSNLLVVVDDMALPVGKLRIRAQGSAGGHNGLKSIIAALGTGDFPRIRVGIGAPGPGSDDIRHVLTSFSREELPAIRATVETAAEVVPFILAQGLDAAMSRFN